MHYITFIGLGILVGIVLGMTGGGGSILTLPILIYFGRLSLEQANVISLSVVSSIAALGAIKQTIKKEVDWSAAFLFSATGLVAAPLTVLILPYIDKNMRIFSFSILMLIVAANILIQTFGTHEEKNIKAFSYVPIHITLISGAICGALTGFFGVGGGFLIVSLLSFVFRMPYNRSLSTSLAVISILSTSALIGYFVKGISLDYKIFIPFTLGGILGLSLGISLLEKIQENTVKRIFGFTVGFLAIFILIDNFLVK